MITIMPYGKYEGKKMEDVPDDYLLWLYDNDKATCDVKNYIESEMTVQVQKLLEKRNKFKNKY